MGVGVHLRAPSASSHPSTPDSKHVCDPSKLSECITGILHLFTPLLRVFFLIPLFFALFSPRVAYLPVNSQPEIAEPENAPLVDHSGVLLQEEEDNGAAPGSESSKYGTFAQGQPRPTAVTVRAEVSPCSFLIASILIRILKCQSTLATLWHLGPYVLPAKGLIVSFSGSIYAHLTGLSHQSLITLLHVLTRLLTPLIPLSVGAALDAFVSSSSTPIPTPLGTSPYTYIFVFTLLHFLVSNGGVPNLTKALVSRLGEGADDELSSHYIDHVLGLALGCNKAKAPEGLFATTGGAITKVLYAVSDVAAAIDDDLIGVVVLGVLFGWEFGLAVLIALSIYGMFAHAPLICHNLTLSGRICYLPHLSPLNSLCFPCQGLSCYFCSSSPCVRRPFAW